MRIYLLSFDSGFGTMQQVTNMLTTSGLVAAWRFDLQTCVYFTSESSAAILSNAFRQAIRTGMFIITEISADPERCNGWITLDSWNFIRTKQLKPQSQTAQTPQQKEALNPHSTDWLFPR